MTRLLLLAPADAGLSASLAAAPGVADAGTEIVVRPVTLPSAPPLGGHDWVLADLAILAAGQKADREGFDAVCLADPGDYGALALRSVLSIPVVTAGRTGLLHALTLSGHVTVAVTARDANRMRKLVHDYALESQCAGVVEVATSADVRRLADGAEVLLLAGAAAGLAPADLPVPAVDPVLAAVKMAESFLGLGLTHSRHAYPEPQARKPALIEALMA